LRSGRKLPKTTNVGAKVDDSAEIDFALNFLYLVLLDPFLQRKWSLIMIFLRLSGGGSQYSPLGCHQTDSKICKVLEGFVHS